MLNFELLVGLSECLINFKSETDFDTYVTMSMHADAQTHLWIPKFSFSVFISYDGIQVVLFMVD